MLGAHLKSVFLFSAAMSLPLGLATAQTAPAASNSQRPVGQTAAPTAAQPAGTQPAAPDALAPAPLPPAVWTVADAQQLLAVIQSIGAEGLDPLDYDPQGLIAALRGGNPAALSQSATDRFNRLSSDMALGHVRGKDRQDWHIADKDLDEEAQALLLRSALAQHRIGDALRNLLPTHPQYASLKTALAVTPTTESAKINRIRLNMDRWRWLPRDLGERYIIVNVPAYTAALVEGGITKSRHHAVAGALKTPTPQLSAMATGVILNPWWEVPKSLEGEVRGRPGYVPFKGPDGKILRWRQPPGPRNALGQIKFVMWNPKSIYLHDTNARGLFDNKMRAYSHGCIRTEHILDLAKILLEEDGGEWDAARVDATIANKKTVQANFVKPLPVYIVYMSSAATIEGKIVDYADIYKRDGKVIAALLDVKSRTNTPTAPAAPDKVAAR
jgi:murein L,D-transpeptidase YcbB/YkuD